MNFPNPENNHAKRCSEVPKSVYKHYQLAKIWFWLGSLKHTFLYSDSKSHFLMIFGRKIWIFLIQQIYMERHIQESLNSCTKTTQCPKFNSIGVIEAHFFYILTLKGTFDDFSSKIEKCLNLCKKIIQEPKFDFDGVSFSQSS